VSTSERTVSFCTGGGSGAGADWAAWLPGTCQEGRLVRLPGKTPPRQMLK